MLKTPQVADTASVRYADFLWPSVRLIQHPRGNMPAVYLRF
nr:MAG TPA: hypothetical protein [Caudoviricetes sp.]